MHTIRHDGCVDCGQPDGPTIHYSRSGSGRLDLGDGETVHLGPRTVVVVPPHRRAQIVTATAPPRTTAHRLEGVCLAVACLGIRATYQGSIGLFDHLREPLVETFAAGDPIRQSFEELVDEASANRAGPRAMGEALLQRCLIWLLRRVFQRDECRLGWLAALEDARLGRAVAAMHDRPQHCFTLPELAEVAGMSRSVFAARFARVLGQSPIKFLKALRLGRAAQLLTRTDLPVKGIAARVGYSSRSAFTRAFLARHGIAPAAFRATGRVAAFTSGTSARVA